MQCPECNSNHIRKNGRIRGKQNHICVDCRRQFIDVYTAPQGYSNEIKRQCLKMSVNGMGFRGIERVTAVHHTTVINWVRQVGEHLPDAYEPETNPEVGKLDELETFIGSKNTKFGSGRRLTTFNRETIVLRRLPHCGQWCPPGNVTSMSLMAGRYTQDLSTRRSDC